MEEIRFYRTTGQYGFLSNLFLQRIHVDGEDFISAEHAYQYGKTNDPKIKRYIRDAPYCRLAAIVGHGLFPYDVVPDWNFKKVERMQLVLAAKFKDILFRQMLLSTGDAKLVEASKTDAFWGIGKKENGKNMLGILLMELREKLRRESDGNTL